MFVAEIEKRILAAFGAVETQGALEDPKLQILKKRILRLLRDVKIESGYIASNDLHIVK
jgi:hypothetical protein